MRREVKGGFATRPDLRRVSARVLLDPGELAACRLFGSGVPVLSEELGE